MLKLPSGVNCGLFLLLIIDKKQKGLFTGCSAFEVQSVLGQKVCGAESGDGENDFHKALDFKPPVLKIKLVNRKIIFNNKSKFSRFWCYCLKKNFHSLPLWGFSGIIKLQMERNNVENPSS